MAFGSQSTDDITDINITPFVDVVLVLLVIFMVTAPLMAQQILDIQLPSAKTSTESAAKTLGVAVNSQGQILLNGVLTTESDLMKECIEQVRLNPQVQVLIAADGESRHKDVVKVIDLVKRTGAKNLAFQVESSPTTDKSSNEVD